MTWQLWRAKSKPERWGQTAVSRKKGGYAPPPPPRVSPDPRRRSCRFFLPSSCCLSVSMATGPKDQFAGVPALDLTLELGFQPVFLEARPIATPWRLSSSLPLCGDCRLSASQKDIPCISPQCAASGKTKSRAFYPLVICVCKTPPPPPVSLDALGY